MQVSSSEELPDSTLISGLETCSQNPAEEPSSDAAYTGSGQPGIAVIIRNINFSGAVRNRIPHDEEHEELVNVLKNLGYQVQSFMDKTPKEMISIIETATKDAAEIGSFLCIVSSHGVVVDEKQYITTHNGNILINELLKSADSQSLKGKPKIFLLQCCRGKRFPANIDLDEDEKGGVSSASLQEGQGHDIKYLNGSPNKELPWKNTDPIKLPRDYFVHFSTNEGFVSFRSEFFLQSWCRVLSKPDGSRNIKDLGSEVNNIVNTEFLSNVPSKAGSGMHQRKQTPEIYSKLLTSFCFPQYKN